MLSIVWSLRVFEHTGLFRGIAPNGRTSPARLTVLITCIPVRRYEECANLLLGQTVSRAESIPGAAFRDLRHGNRDCEARGQFCAVD